MRSVSLTPPSSHCHQFLSLVSRHYNLIVHYSYSLWVLSFRSLHFREESSTQQAELSLLFIMIQSGKRELQLHVCEEGKGVEEKGRWGRERERERESFALFYGNYAYDVEVLWPSLHYAAPGCCRPNWQR